LSRSQKVADSSRLTTARVVTVTMPGAAWDRAFEIGVDLRQGSSDARIIDSITKGRAFGMPAWAKMLTPAQIRQLTA
jgi:mono/diheme cytochrome c family protein